MNVLFTCGGTAGHVNPAVALAHIFQEKHPGCRVLFAGADGGMENKLVPKEGYQIRTVTITNFHRSFAPAEIVHNLGTLVNLGRSKKQAQAILDEFRPDLVVGTGGYASFPVVNEAARRKIPTAVHESNAVPGLTTKALSKVVDRVMVGFEESRAHYDDPEKVVVTGVTLATGEYANICYDRDHNSFWKSVGDYIPVHYPGTGDIFAAVLTASLLQGDSLPLAMDRAARYVELTIKTTYSYSTDPREGVMLERTLEWLTRKEVSKRFQSL